MMRWSFLGIVFLTAYNTFAVQLTPTQIHTAVNNWLKAWNYFHYSLGIKVHSSRFCKTPEGAGFHVVKLEGGGFVVTSSDTQIEPIIAFSSDEDLIEDERNSLWILIKKDIAARTKAQQSFPPISAGPNLPNSNEEKWKYLLRSFSIGTLDSKPTVSDLRVAPLIQSQWSQGNYDGSFNQAPEKACYNYYTPHHYVCGCVATAGAQLMRYHCYPTKKVSRRSYPCRIDGLQKSLTMQGGYYDWGRMPLIPAHGISLEERQCIGKLLSDVGISVNMEYYANGSGAGVINLMRCFKNCFHYKNAKYVWFIPSGNDYSFPYNLERLKKIVIPNLDAKLPVCMGITGTPGGHAIVADGYGYEKGQFYLHVNLGWAGNHDAWYLPPNIDEFTAIDEFVYNVFPTQTANASIISGRVLSEETGKPMSHVSITARRSSGKIYTCETNEKGIYFLILPQGNNYNFTADNGYSIQKKKISVATCQCITPASNGMVNMRNQVIGNLYNQDFALAEPPPPIMDEFQTVATEGETCSIITYVDWEANIEDSVSWLTLITSKGMGSDPLVFQVEPNQTGSARKATIKVVPAVGGKAVFLEVRQSSQHWNNTAEKAFSTAEKENKRIFLFAGHENCKTCNQVYHDQCESIDNKDGVKKILKDGYVLWKSNLSARSNDAAEYLTLSADPPHPQMRIIDPDTPKKTIAKIDGVPQEGQLQNFFIENWVTHTTGKVKVPYTWILENTTVTNFNFEENAWIDTNDDGFSNWEEFITGADPKNPETKFQCKIQIVNGKPVITTTFTNDAMATCIIEGKVNLSDPTWAPTNSTHRFFRARIIPK